MRHQHAQTRQVADDALIRAVEAGGGGVIPATAAGLVFVLTTGSDATGNGSISKPYATIDHAVAAIVAAGTANAIILIGSGSFAAPTALPGYISLNGLDPNDSPGLTGSIGLAPDFVADGLVFLGNITIFDPQTIDFGTFTGAGLSLFNSSFGSDCTVEGGAGGWTYYAQSAAFAGTTVFEDAVIYTSLKSSYLGPTTLHAANTSTNAQIAGDTVMGPLMFEADAGRTLTVEADHLVFRPFTTSGAGTVNYAGNATIQRGTPNEQAALIQRFQVVATTTGAGAVTVDTGYRPPSTHTSNMTGDATLVDRAANTASSQTGLGVIYNNAGTLSIRGQTWSVAAGDASLSSATILFGVSAGNTLTVTLTPPAAYGGTLDWQIEPLLATEN